MTRKPRVVIPQDPEDFLVAFTHIGNTTLNQPEVAAGGLLETVAVDMDSAATDLQDKYNEYKAALNLAKLKRQEFDEMKALETTRLRQIRDLVFGAFFPASPMEITRFGYDAYSTPASSGSGEETVVVPEGEDPIEEPGTGTGS